MDGDISYLQKDFDPHTLKVNQLKKIFIFHDIYFPTSAKKAQLIEIFEQQVTPNSNKLMKQLKADNTASVNPIEDATAAFDENQESHKNTKSKHNKKSNSSSKNKSTTPDDSGISMKKETSPPESEKKIPSKMNDLSKRSTKKQSKETENDDSTSFASNNSMQHEKQKSKKRSSSVMEQEDSNSSRTTRSRSSDSTNTKKKSKTGSSSAGNFFDLSGSDMDTSEDFEKLINNNLKDSAQILKSPQRSLKHNLKDILGSNTKKKNHLSRPPVKEKSSSRAPEVNKDSIHNTFATSKTLYQLLDILDSDELAKQLGITIQGQKPKKAFDPLKDSIIFNDSEEKQQSKNDEISGAKFESSPTRTGKTKTDGAASMKMDRKKNPNENLKPPFRQVNPDRANHVVGQSMISKASLLSKKKEQHNQPVEYVGKIAEVIPLKHDDDDNNIGDEGPVESAFHKEESKIEVPSSQSSQEQHPSTINQSALSYDHDSITADSELTKVDHNASEEEKINVGEEEGDTEQINVITAANHTFFSYLKSLFVFALIVFLSFFGYWYLQKRIYVGYCGYSVNNFNILPNPNNNQYITEVEYLLNEYASPKCIECPENAICHPFFDITCQEGFLKVKPFNSWITGKKCIPDIRRKRRIETMTHVALNILRQRNTNFDCGKGTDLQAGLPLEDIHDILFETRSSDVSVEEFEEIWNKVKDRIEATDDIVTVRQVI